MDQLNNPSTEAQTLELVEHEGVVVTLGKRQYVLPPMTIKTRRMEYATRKAMSEGIDAAREQDLMLQVVVEALRRNYPSISLEQIEVEASFPQLTEAYALMSEQEMELITELGKRMAARKQAASLGNPDSQG